MSESVTQTVPPSIHIANHELSGRLNRASGQGALFSLYLAIQMQPGAVHPGYAEAPEEPVNEAAFLQQLNQYRRPPLAAETGHLSSMAQNSMLVANNDIAGLHLWQAMHPDPLSATDDARKISPDVLDNCSLAVRLKQFQQAEQYCAHACDETLLDEVIAGSRTLLSA